MTPEQMKDWTLCLYWTRAKAREQRPFQWPDVGSPRLAQFERSLSKRRAKNKVARASRKANR